ncbi:MAG: TrmB family transcriptional regulator [Methanomicrobiales archaeon]|nr:TrmB family transcriptional regulator [Methanomicrobiales archaeon]
MDSAAAHLVQLGLKEYEAKIYVALVGLGEANARRIHEASGVPRPRVYDVLDDLAARGFIDVREGSPLTYSAVSPEMVISHLKRDFETAAHEGMKALEGLSLDAQRDSSPIWYVRSDWTIRRYLEMVVEGVERELVVLCFDTGTLKRFLGPINRIARDRTVKILFPRGLAAGITPGEGVTCYEAGTLRNFFGLNIFEKVFSAPISREGAVFRLECILLADDRESMLIYTLDGNRMAVIITLPFITSVQSQLFSQMIARAREVKTGSKSEDPGRSMRRNADPRRTTKIKG